MATTPKQMAEIVRRLSAKNAPKDTVLAAITPKEAAILKARGGSGKVDPVTGVKHFYDDPGGDENNDTDNTSSNTPDSTKDSTKDRDPSNESRANLAQAARDVAMNTLGKSLGAQSTEGTDATGYSATVEHQGFFGRLVAAARALFSGAATLGNLTTGNILGAALTGYDAYKNIKTASTDTKVTVNSPSSSKVAASLQGIPSTASDSTRTGAGLVAAKSLTDTSTGLLGGTTKITPTFDYFQAIARSKQGQKSTVLGGGTGSSPASTSLLGV